MILVMILMVMILVMILAQHRHGAGDHLDNLAAFHPDNEDHDHQDDLDGHNNDGHDDLNNDGRNPGRKNEFYSCDLLQPTRAIKVIFFLVYSPFTMIPAFSERNLV